MRRIGPVMHDDRLSDVELPHVADSGCAMFDVAPGLR
jgi:hypothetical protein